VSADIVRAAASGDRAAQAALIEKYRPLAKFQARRFSQFCGDYDDLVQVASMALLTAAQTFDAAKGLSFRGYARQWINEELRRVQRNSGAVRVRYRGSASELRASADYSEVSEEHQVCHADHEAAERDAAVRQVLREVALTPAQRAALEDWMTHDSESFAETAARLGRAKQSIRVRMIGAFARLRPHLKRRLAGYAEVSNG